ncbi:MAG: site-specific integrase [Clostridia bacterium]|nr:site-specific integrase [Clostridia bacterium]
MNRPQVETEIQNKGELYENCVEKTFPSDGQMLCESDGRNAHDPIKFLFVAEEWLSDKKLFVKESTYARYRYLTDKHILPELGNVDMGELANSHLESMLRDKFAGKGDNLSPKTLRDILSVFRLIVCYAEDKEYITPGRLGRDIPLFLSKKKDSRIVVMKNNEREVLEKHLMKNVRDPKAFGILLALYTGLRIGELCALRWQDVDLRNRVLYVRHTLLRLHDYSGGENKTKIVMDTPKTESSCREIPLTSFLYDKLTKLYGTGKSSDVFFVSGSEKPQEPRTYLYYYKRQLSLCGLPPYTFHILRHTFATRCVEAGIDIKALSEVLGHSSIKITLDRYVHPSVESKRRQLELICGDFLQNYS